MCVPYRSYNADISFTRRKPCGPGPSDLLGATFANDRPAPSDDHSAPSGVEKPWEIITVRDSRLVFTERDMAPGPWTPPFL